MTIVTGDRSLRLVATAFDAYRRIFVGSGLAPLLSQPNPVRHTGFDLDLVVERVEVEATDVLSVTLGAADGAPLPRWQPGAHLDVFLPSGRQRQYSLCGDPGDPGDPRRYRIAVRLLHAGGGGSREIHESLRVGDPLRVRGPRNAFRLVTADSYTFVAGGIGITPILPMVKAVAARGVPWRMTYLGRTRASMPFLAELPGDVDVRPDDETGRPDLAALLAGIRPGGAVYVCGPPPLLDAARRIDPAGSLHTERFSAPPVRGGTPFDVELRRTGVTVTVGADESALAAIRRVVPGVAYSCQQGFCGSCRTTVLSGRPDSSMLICVSRSDDGSLVLDL